MENLKPETYYIFESKAVIKTRSNYEYGKYEESKDEIKKKIIEKLKDNKIDIINDVILIRAREITAANIEIKDPDK